MTLRTCETKRASAPEFRDEPGWDLPGDLEIALEDLVLTGRATRHVRDDGRVLYEIQWSGARPSVACAYH
jgi:hypothetical protein